MRSTATDVIDPTELKILIVGDKQKIIQGLESLGHPIFEVDSEGAILSG